MSMRRGGDQHTHNRAATRGNVSHPHPPLPPISSPGRSGQPRPLAAPLTRRNAIKGVVGGTALGVVGLPAAVQAQALASAEQVTTPPSRMRRGDTFLAASQAPVDFALPAELESVSLDPQAGFDLPIGRFRATFIPRAGLLGPQGDPQRLLQEPMIMAMVVTCLKKIWWIESEPAGDQTFTMVAYAADEAAGGSGRLAVLSGQGVVPDRGRGVEFSLQTVPALAGSDRHDQITATVSAQPDGSYEGQVEVTEVAAEKYPHGHGDCHKRCSKKSGTAHRRCKHRCRKHR